MSGWLSGDAEIDQLAAALDALLTELVEYRLSRPSRQDCLRLVAIPSTEEERRAAHFSHIVADPFEGSLLYALRGVGEALFERGGTRLMRNVLMEIAAHDQSSVKNSEAIEGAWFSACLKKLFPQGLPMFGVVFLQIDSWASL